MMAVGSLKNTPGTALAARGEHDQISVVAINSAVRIVRPVANAAIWIGNEGLVRPDHRKFDFHRLAGNSRRELRVSALP